MKKLLVLSLVLSALLIVACDKDDDVSERFRFLTSVEWQSDSLLVNGIDASGDGQLLAGFNGRVQFNENGTGSFGDLTGTWRFANNETELVLHTPELPAPITTKIEELTANSLKVSTGFPNPLNPVEELKIRMTFKAL